MKITFSKRSYVTLYFLQFEAMKYGANFQSQSTQDNGTRENEEKIKRREAICSQTYIQHDRNASIEITLRTSKELFFYSYFQDISTANHYKSDLSLLQNLITRSMACNNFLLIISTFLF